MCLGIPGEIVSVHDQEGVRFGQVRFAGVLREVCLECEPEAAVGDFVLVHVGFAIARLDRAEAERQWALLAELGAVDEALGVPEARGGEDPGDGDEANRAEEAAGP